MTPEQKWERLMELLGTFLVFAAFFGLLLMAS
jgi:hypothetical protein